MKIKCPRCKKNFDKKSNLSAIKFIIVYIGSALLLIMLSWYDKVFLRGFIIGILFPFICFYTIKLFDTMFRR